MLWKCPGAQVNVVQIWRLIDGLDLMLQCLILNSIAFLGYLPL